MERIRDYFSTAELLVMEHMVLKAIDSNLSYAQFCFMLNKLKNLSVNYSAYSTLHERILLILKEVESEEIRA